MDLQVLAFARDNAVAPSGPSILVPEPPDEQRPEQPDPAHDHQDHAHRVEVETLRVHVDSEVEDRSDGDEEQAHADTHVRSTSRPATIGLRISQPRIDSMVAMYPSGPAQETKRFTNRPIRPIRRTGGAPVRRIGPGPGWRLRRPTRRR